MRRPSRRARARCALRSVATRRSVAWSSVAWSSVARCAASSSRALCPARPQLRPRRRRARPAGMPRPEATAPAQYRLVQVARHCTMPAVSGLKTQPLVGGAGIYHHHAPRRTAAAKTSGRTNQSDAGRSVGPRLSLATCQFGVTADIRTNVAQVKQQMRQVCASRCADRAGPVAA